jgi:hypothetical protein
MAGIILRSSYLRLPGNWDYRCVSPHWAIAEGVLSALALPLPFTWFKPTLYLGFRLGGLLCQEHCLSWGLGDHSSQPSCQQSEAPLGSG